MTTESLRSKKGRILLAMALMALSLLLLGAGRITKERLSHNHSIDAEKRDWLALNAGFGKHLPLEHREKWMKASRIDPQLFVRINTVAFSRLEAVPESAGVAAGN
jgi:hypothetical protein